MSLEQVQDYIYEQEEPQQQLLQFLHEVLMGYMQFTCKIRYRIPFYYLKSWICYLNPTKTGGVELAFVRGNELNNENGALQFKDRKQIGGITYHNIQEIDTAVIFEILQEAILLDETIPYSNRKKKM